MSNGFWQTRRQGEQFPSGKLASKKVEGYVRTWEGRCYSDGIPDVVTSGLMRSGRVPSYKAIALALLKNDVSLKSLGFSGKYSDFYGQLKRSKLEEEGKIPKQFSLFRGLK